MKLVRFVRFFLPKIHNEEVGNMNKPLKSKAKPAVSRNGKLWIHVPSMNIRQGSGVQFWGKYITLKEYKEHVRRRQILEGE